MRIKYEIHQQSHPHIFYSRKDVQPGVVNVLYLQTSSEIGMIFYSKSYRYRTCPDPAFYENLFLYRNQNNNSTNQIDTESSSLNNERRSVNGLLAGQYPNSQNTINNTSGLYQSQTSRQCDVSQNEIRTNNVNNDHQANRRESDQNSLLQQGRFGSLEVNATAARMTENFSPVESNESTKEVYCSANSNEENSYFVNQKSQQPLQKSDHLHQKQSQSQMTTLCLPIADTRFTQENVIVGGSGDDDDPSTASTSSGGKECRAAKYFVAPAISGCAAAIATCVYQQQQSRTGSDVDHIMGPVVKRAKIE
uniref:Uncharacterized protein n=1 Tax=Romanomermis culicivorax TaxID=13658 RepID=A0A915HIU6_ROMCU